MITAINTAVEDMMSESPSTKESEKEKKPEGRWALFTGIGSFLLYLFGYLSLRFHLSVLGVDTGLSVLDERYLFAGAQFLVYLLTSFPVAVIFLVIAGWLLRRLRPEHDYFRNCRVDCSHSTRHPAMPDVYQPSSAA
jgi:hypothetical protein